MQYLDEFAARSAFSHVSCAEPTPQGTIVQWSVELSAIRCQVPTLKL